MEATFEYSNNGFIVAGAMLEAATGLSWEGLMQKEVFAPLGIEHAGFGAPLGDDPHAQPRGHVPADGADQPAPPNADNPAALGPAGRVHMPLADMARYLRAHATRDAAFLKPESWEVLHNAPFGGPYAMGWIVSDDGRRWHNGSNTMWYAEATFRPDGTVAAVAVNDGDIASGQPAVRSLLEEADGVGRARGRAVRRAGAEGGLTRRIRSVSCGNADRTRESCLAPPQTRAPKTASRPSPRRAPALADAGGGAMGTVEQGGRTVNRKRPAWRCLGLALVVSAPVASAQRASVGEVVPDFAFEPLRRGDGRQQLAEFRGQPVLIALFADLFGGLEAARGAIDLAEDFGEDGLEIVLLEDRSGDPDFMEELLLRELPGAWFRFGAKGELPIRFERNGAPPQVALIGVDGTLLLAGSYTIDLSRAKKRIPAELKRARAGWGNHEAARRARGLAFGADRLAEARALLDEALAREPEAGELAAALGEVETRYAVERRAVDHLRSSGEVERARARAALLVRAVAGLTDREADAAALLASFDEPAWQAELALERKLRALLKPISKKPPKKRDAAKLRKLAKAAPETRVGARALHLAERIEALEAR